MSTTPNKVCESCGSKGWVHSQEPFEIQRDDDCDTFKDDAEALVAHAATCGCDWPPFDLQAAFLSWAEDICAYALPESLSDKAYALKDLGRQRLEFVQNLDTLLDMTGELIHQATYTYKDNDQFLASLRGIGSLLLLVKYLVKSGAWKDYWLLEVEDGLYDEETDRWHAPTKH